MRTASLSDILHLVLEYDQALGFYHWEKKRKQKLIVDVELNVDASKAFRSDHLRDAIDYDAIDLLIQKLLKKRHYNLIETIAEDIAQAILSKWPVKGVKITVDKPLAMAHARKISFSVCRTKK